MKEAFRYGPADSQTGDLHRPDAGDRWPVVCLLHGGFWRAPHGRGQMDAIATDLAARGHAVWNIGYRRIGEPGGGWPGTLDDVAAAIDHLVVLADDEPRLDLQRVVVVGHSAGGQLALWACAQPGRARRFAPGGVAPVAACALAAVADLDRAFGLGMGQGAVAELLGGPPEARPGRYAHASPRRLLPLGLRQLVMHGADDTVVPPDLSRDYVHAARAAGDRVEHIEVPAMGHMEFLDPASDGHARLCHWLGEVMADPASGAHA